MKKKLLIIIPLLLVLIVIAGIGIFKAKSLTVEKVYVIPAKNGTCLYYKEGSVVNMTDLTKSKKLFDGLEEGDYCLIVHDGVEATYPGQTGVYFCKMLCHTADAIPYDVIDTLTDMGWIMQENSSDFSENENEQNTDVQTSTPSETLVDTFIITKVNGDFLELRKADSEETGDENLYCCDLSIYDGLYTVGETIKLCYAAQIAETYPAQLTVIEILPTDNG